MNVNELIQGENIDILLLNIISRIHTKGPIFLQDFETLAYIKKFHANTFQIYEEKLMYLIGLFYKTSAPANLLETIYSIYSQTIQERTGSIFTPTQASAYNGILTNKYFSFSAPTSSGKSYLFRDLLRKATGDIIIVIPSRALIAEYMYSVMQIVGNDVLVLQFVENINIAKTRRRIYIITPERGDELFQMLPHLNIEMILFDEAQISEEEIRGMRFDAFVRRAARMIPNAKKIFTHPFINNPEAQLIKHHFTENAAAKAYTQNSVGKIFMIEENGVFKYFSPYLQQAIEHEAENIVTTTLQNNGTVLIYTSKNKLYSGEYKINFNLYIQQCPIIQNPQALAIIEELKEYIGASTRGEKHSLMLDLMQRGVVIHHGSMPLKARLLIEKFVNYNFAKICFATSTLIQGINMPFDIVWINNFKFEGSEEKKNLDLKNLIGRAGRSTDKTNSFDYGYVIIERANKTRFIQRMGESTTLRETSLLDQEIDNINIDFQDVAEAIRNDTFDTELKLTDAQVERITQSDINQDIKLVLDTLVANGQILSGSAYYLLSESKRTKVKQAFQRIYSVHLRRQNLNDAEKGILSTAVPIILWRIQGKSFKEILSLRHSYITQKTLRQQIIRHEKAGLISTAKASEELSKLTMKYSPAASQLPNSNARKYPLFPKSDLEFFDYDILVYDTYDYIDKVISLSLADPLCAAFKIYYSTTNDLRALAMSNYIRFGTNDEQEIWLMKYGFSHEDIEWIKEYVISVDENQIVFSDGIQTLPDVKHEIIRRYI